MIIDIWIENVELKEKNESLGIKTEDPYKTVNFNVKKECIAGYWIDYEPDTKNKTDIVFYAGGNCFRTPHTDNKEMLFKSIIGNE